MTGQQIQQFRKRRQPVERAAFGLPIVFLRNGAKVTSVGERHHRRASLLFIHMTRLSNRKYALVLAFFQAQLLEEHEKLKLERQEPPVYPDLSLIDDFIQEVSSKEEFRPVMEVTGW
ncbi:hypothetical protein A7Q09_04405 [Methylacidiphilum sp. Yel]|uniref:hypothetical protein n=1 Tax=Methylacidiphilum sp. Yel TaxID=1847730 RepID=UPI00106C6883|nr:hypothetical protein [Methylacidiphilum sp. Yel]TFE70039.1 hypothetical protein A7Q09_04405 [Methylacidiphilum sp. Yel]